MTYRPKEWSHAKRCGYRVLKDDGAGMFQWADGKCDCGLDAFLEHRMVFDDAMEIQRAAAMTQAQQLKEENNGLKKALEMILDVIKCKH